MSDHKPWKTIGAEWRDVVLVCRKCSRKLGGGFGHDGDQTLAKALRHAIDGRGKVKARRRAVAVVEVGCLDVCPKGAVVAVKGSNPRRLMLVPKGAGMPEVVERLGLGSRQTGSRPVGSDRLSPAAPVTAM